MNLCYQKVDVESKKDRITQSVKEEEEKQVTPRKSSLDIQNLHCWGLKNDEGTGIHKLSHKVKHYQQDVQILLTVEFGSFLVANTGTKVDIEDQAKSIYDEDVMHDDDSKGHLLFKVGRTFFELEVPTWNPWANVEKNHGEKEWPDQEHN